MQEINLITRRLESARIPYCIVGGLAAVACGRPRLTLDADLVLGLGPGHIKALINAFPIEEFFARARCHYYAQNQA